MRITLRRNTTTITGVIAGAVMRIRVVSELAPDMRLASSREASIRRKAGVMSMTLVETPWVMTCAQIMPQNV